MYRNLKIAPWMLMLCVGCSHGNVKMQSPPPVASPPSSAPTSMPAAAPAKPQIDPRRITETRSHDGHSASGTVLLREPVSDSASDSPPRKLAGVRAWVALGEQRVAAEDWAGAIACAQAGLSELGPDYARREALDHTHMKLLLAKDMLKAGVFPNAAEIMLEQLSTRTRYYVALHSDVIAE